MPSIGTNGTNGVLNALGKSGILLRMTQTPMQTRIKAKSVPMLVISPTTLAGTKAAKALTKTINKRLLFAGVCVIGFTAENTFGIKPSLLMLKNTRLCPINITNMTDAYPARIATTMALLSHG